MKTLVYIPAYNAAERIPGVLDRLVRAAPELSEHLLVVDNASKDATAEAARRHAAELGLSNVEIIRNPQNLGYGGSQKLAFRWAMDRGFTCIAMLHADGQYPPEQLSDLIEPLLSNRADMTFGSRIAGKPLQGGMPLHRFLGNKALTKLGNILLDWNLTEFHSGFRAYRCDALAHVPFERNANDYHFDVDILIQFRHKNLRVAEITIPTHYGTEKSYLNVWQTGPAIIGSMGEYFLHSKGLRRSSRFDFE